MGIPIMEMACEMFDKMPQQNIIAMQFLIRGYVHNEKVHEKGA